MNEDRLQPTTFDQFVGQHALKRTLGTAIDASVATGRPIGNILLTGPAGCGKTSMAHLIADRLGKAIRVVTRPLTRTELEDEVDELGPNSILFLDEVHQTPAATQVALLPLLEEHYLPTRYGNIAYPGFSCIAGTTDRQKLSPPLLTRFRLKPGYVDYTPDELSAITAQLCVQVGLDVGDDIVDGIAGAAAGMPRNCRDLVLLARDLADTQQAVTTDSVLAAAQLECDGLNVDHLAYMLFLREMGQAGLDPISKRLRLHPSVIQELERLLFDLKYIRLDSRGRRLSPTGRARIQERYAKDAKAAKEVA